MTVKSPIFALIAAAVALAPPAFAKGKETARARASALEALTACRAVATDAERLACYDKAAKSLDEAEKAGDVVVVDRAQVREVKRQSFGFNLSALNVFDRGKVEEINKIESTVADAYLGGDGKWIIVTADHQTWRQIAGDVGIYPEPKKGQALVLTHGALGSFFMKLPGGSLRVHRDD